MTNKSVFGIATSEAAAAQIVRRLESAGFPLDDISVMFSDEGRTRDFAHEKNTKAPEGAATGAGAGLVAGGALGWMAGIGMLAIPGVGPFIAAGPILAALSGAAVGGTVGGVAGSLVGMGIPEIEAKQYEGKLTNGNVLLSIHTEDSDEVETAERILNDEGAEDICSSGESSVTDDSEEPAGRRL